MEPQLNGKHLIILYKPMKRIFKLLLLLLIVGNVYGQGNPVYDKVTIGAPFTANSSVLDIVSTTKGALLPRMTTAQRDAIVSPDAGLMIYNTTTNAYNYYDGTTWGEFGGGADGNGIYDGSGSLSGDVSVETGANKLNISTGVGYIGGGTFSVENDVNGLALDVQSNSSSLTNNIRLGDGNKYHISAGSGGLYWSDNAGTQRMRLNQDGELGIGVDPLTGTALRVNGNTRIDGQIGVRVTPNSDYHSIGLDNSNSTTTFKLRSLSNNKLFEVANGGRIDLSNGNIAFSPSGDNFIVTNLTATGDIRFDTNGGTNKNLLLDAGTGYVMVGSSATPSEQLHVNGSTRVDAFNVNQLFVDDTKNFTAIGGNITQTQNEVLRIAGSIHVDSFRANFGGSTSTGS
jgi:hypothetical protein